MAQYFRVPPPGYGPYDYSTSASTSPVQDPSRYPYYVSAYGSPAGSPDGYTRRHHIRTTSYTQPKVSTWATSSAPAYGSSPHYASNLDYSSPPRAYTEFVSPTDSRKKPTIRRNSVSGYGNGGGNTHSQGDKRYAYVRSPKRGIYVDATAKADDRYYNSSAEEATYVHAEPRVRRQSFVKKSVPKADPCFFFTQNTDEADTPTRSRARRNSTNTRAKPTKPPVITPATAEDARKHNIQAGYCLKNWDATEEPIVLLGSVFDANSLGKWIYDWTVFHHKAHSPLSEVAGELWLLLIKFSGKRKRAEHVLGRIRNKEDKSLIEDFLKASDRIWAKLKDLLKNCEGFMWRTAKDGSKTKVMGQNSGIEFVKSIFGRDRELEKTERFMTNIRTWNMRFDANCESIIKRKH